MAGRVVVELRIHGVGGGSARDLLGEGVDPVGDAAEDIAGFWEAPDPAGDPPRVRQVYSWGGFSARNASRALWVLLLPFTVANLAGWMVDPDAGPGLTALQRSLVRLVAYTETVLLTVSAASIAFTVLDGWPLGRRITVATAVAGLLVVLVAVATVRSRRYERYGVDEPIEEEAVADDDLFLADPEFWRTADVVAALRRGELAVAAAAVAFLPALALWRLIESTPALGVAGCAIVAAALAVSLGLARRTGPLVGWLAALATLLAGAAASLAWLSDLDVPSTAVDAMWSAAPLWVLVAAGGLLVALAVTECLAWVARDGRTVVWSGGLPAARLRLIGFTGGVGAVTLAIGAADGSPLPRWWLAAALGAAASALPVLWAIARGFRPDRPFLVVTVAGVTTGAVLFWYVDWLDGRLLSPTAGGGILVGVLAFLVPASLVLLASRRTGGGVVAAMVIGLTVMLAAGDEGAWWLGVGVATAAFAVPAIAEVGRRDRFRWLPVTTVAALSVLLLAVTLSGLSWIAAWFAGSLDALPSGYRWVTATFTGALVAGALGIAVHLVHRRREWWPTARVSNEYVGQSEPCRTVMATKAGRRRAVADVVNDVDAALTVVVWTAGLALITGLVRTGRPDLEVWSLERIHFAVMDRPWPGSWGWLSAAGAWLGAALPVLAVVVLLLALRFAPIRRKVGVVWDVGTFWPRRFHPLAPPAYAERAVPELVGHVRGLVGEGKGVILVGHSQGSVLALATAVQLGGTDPHRLAALTHGSPVGRYYRRFWPGVFGDGIAAGVAASWSREGGGERWWNAHRLTDPIGGPLFTGPDERIGEPDTDVCLPDPRPDRTGCPDAKGHIGHLTDPDVVARLDELGAMVSAQGGEPG